MLILIAFGVIVCGNIRNKRFGRILGIIDKMEHLFSMLFVACMYIASVALATGFLYIIM